MITVRRSDIDKLGFDFEAEVENFRQAKLAHRYTTGEPAPAARHPLVEQAVVRVPPQEDGQPDEFASEYEIIEDLPTGDPEGPVDTPIVPPTLQ